MIYSSDINPNYLFQFGEDGLYCTRLDNECNMIGEEFTKEVDLDNIMLSSNIVDKNGITLYDGDIVVSFTWNNDSYESESNWYPCYLIGQIIHTKGGFIIKNKYEEQMQTYLSEHIVKIGNIYDKKVYNIGKEVSDEYFKL